MRTLKKKLKYVYLNYEIWIFAYYIKVIQWPFKSSFQQLLEEYKDEIFFKKSSDIRIFFLYGGTVIGNCQVSHAKSFILI